MADLNHKSLSILTLVKCIEWLFSASLLVLAVKCCWNYWGDGYSFNWFGIAAIYVQYLHVGYSTICVNMRFYSPAFRPLTYTFV